MCVYIFGRFTFKILGQALLLWFNVLLFSYCYILLSLFISITIILTIFFMITVFISKYIIQQFSLLYYLPVFTIVITYILTIFWFQLWFPFCHCFLRKLYVIIFGWFFKPRSLPFFFPCSFSVVTVNCGNRGRIQINDFERYGLPLPFNYDW